MRVLQTATRVFAAVMLGGMLKGYVDGRRLAAAANANANAERTQSGDDGERPLEPTTHDETRMPLPKLPPELLKRDAVAWPTVALCGGSLGVWALAWRLHATRRAPWFVSTLIAAAAQYWSFTVLHDAVHSAAAPKHKWLNDLLGHVSAFVLGAPYPIFKHAHLLHHRFAGDHDSAPDGTSLDPDLYAGQGPTWLLPLRWASIGAGYAHLLTKWFTYRSHAGTTSPQALKTDASLKRSLVAFLVAFHVARVWLQRRFGRDAVVVCWLGPQLLSVTFLAYLFDYVPHRPHVIPYKQDPYRSTNVTSLLGSVDGTLWTSASMAQNLHSVHHAWPWVPFYRYRAVWRAVGDELTKHGTRVVPLYLDSVSRRELFDEVVEVGLGE